MLEWRKANIITEVFHFSTDTHSTCTIYQEINVILFPFFWVLLIIFILLSYYADKNLQNNSEASQLRVRNHLAMISIDQDIWVDIGEI